MKVKVSRADHIEIPVTDLNKAKKFYTQIFGWKEIMQDWGETYMLVSTEDPDWTSFGIYKTDKISPNGVVVTMRTDDVDKSLKTVEKAGGKILREKYEIAPEIGHGAEFEDPFGNKWGLHSPPS